MTLKRVTLVASLAIAALTVGACGFGGDDGDTSVAPPPKDPNAEASGVELSRDVLARIPKFLDRPTVLGIGEIGLNKNTRNESIIFMEHVELAERFGSVANFGFKTLGRSKFSRIADLASGLAVEWRLVEEDQDRARWDRLLIRRGLEGLRRSCGRGPAPPRSRWPLRCVAMTGTRPG